MNAGTLKNIEKLESDLWEAADNLRANSKLTSSDYFMPVLGVIFLRHAANRFEAAHWQIDVDQACGKMPKRKVLPADYIARRSLYLPEQARYDWIMQQAAISGADLPRLVTEAMTAIETEFEPLLGEVLFGTVKPGYYVAYLNLGLHLAPTADQDNHYRTWGTLTEARTVVLAPKLTRSEILQAMKQRRVYASEDKDLRVGFTVNGQLMGSINPSLATGVPATIKVIIKDSDEPDSAYRVTVFYDERPGGALASQVGVFNVDNNSSGTFEHTPTAGKGYYFVVVTSTEDANQGYSAWTAPVWFE